MCSDARASSKFFISSISNISSTPFSLYWAVKIIFHKHWIQHISVLFWNVQWLLTAQANSHSQTAHPFPIITDILPHNNQVYNYRPCSFPKEDHLQCSLKEQLRLNPFCEEAPYSQGSGHNPGRRLPYMEATLPLCNQRQLSVS